MGRLEVSATMKSKSIEGRTDSFQKVSPVADADEFIKMYEQLNEFLGNPDEDFDRIISVDVKYSTK